MNKLIDLLRYDWPLHFTLLLTNWLPDNVIFLRLRGAIARLFIGHCGKDLRIGRNVLIHNPKLLIIGDHVFIAYGCNIMATDNIKIDDEVMFGPYCVAISGNHTSYNSSFRYGKPSLDPISIGKGSWLGAHVVVTAGTTIGQNCLIAAGAVVAADIQSNTVAGGIPARPIKKIE